MSVDRTRPEVSSRPSKRRFDREGNQRPLRLGLVANAGYSPSGSEGKQFAKPAPRQSSETEYYRSRAVSIEALNAVLVEHSEISDPFFTWSGRGTGNMDEQLRTVTVRIAHVAEGGVRAWSDDLKGLSLTCANHDALFAQLTPTIASLLEQQGLSGRIVREIHQFIMEVKQI
jgi:hypothetical protein